MQTFNSQQLRQQSEQLKSQAKQTEEQAEREFQLQLKAITEKRKLAMERSRQQRDHGDILRERADRLAQIETKLAEAQRVLAEATLEHERELQSIAEEMELTQQVNEETISGLALPETTAEGEEEVSQVDTVEVEALDMTVVAEPRETRAMGFSDAKEVMRERADFSSHPEATVNGNDKTAVATLEKPPEPKYESEYGPDKPFPIPEDKDLTPLEKQEFIDIVNKKMLVGKRREMDWRICHARAPLSIEKEKDSWNDTWADVVADVKRMSDDLDFENGF